MEISISKEFLKDIINQIERRANSMGGEPDILDELRDLYDNANEPADVIAGEDRCLCVGNYKNGCKIHGGEWRMSPPLI